MGGRRAFVLFAACVLNLLPFWLHQIGGDIFIHLSAIQCYAAQFWQGDVLPRWCFEGDGGIGSPAPLFYPPLPFVVSSLLYPLTWAGASVYAIYALSAALATFVTALGAYRWLKAAAGPGAAVAGAVLLLFLPYRTEVVFGRSGFGEMWVIAFAPWMLLAARNLLQRRKNAAIALTLWTALALLSEPPVTVCVLVAIGVQVLAHGAHAWQIWLRTALAILLALALTAFYALPVLHYLPFVHIAQTGQDETAWANRFVRVLEDIEDGRMRYMAGLLVTTLGAFWLMLRILRRTQYINSPYERTEALAWCVTAPLALFMLFSVSAPLWWLIGLAAPLAFPWRMQIVLVLSVSYLFAAYVRWYTGHRRRRTAHGDFTSLILFLFCLQIYMASTIAPENQERLDKLVAARAVSYRESRTQWSPPLDPEDSIRRRESGGPPPQVEILSGSAAVQVRHWSWRGMIIDASAMKGPVELRLYQRYFPLWQLWAENAETAAGAIALAPEAETGLMHLTLPEGTHTIVIAPERYRDSILGKGARWELQKQKAASADVAAEQP